MNLFERIKTENTVFQTLVGVKFAAFVTVLLSPLQAVCNAFDVYVTAKRYELSFNGQVCYLEHILNDKFDNTLRRINITDPPQLTIEPLSISTIQDGQTAFLLFNLSDTRPNGTANIFNIADFVTQLDFILNVPTDLSGNINPIKKVCDAYKEASKYYTVNLF